MKMFYSIVSGNFYRC